MSSKDTEHSMNWEKLICDILLKPISQFFLRCMSDESCIYILICPNFEEFDLATIITRTVSIEGMVLGFFLVFFSS